ncbi:MAG: neutral/alkaline non-lysosomal ceramidase N-terminal domain-containing protein [Actinobacteria bacterium]|nr:neutral/alkaline non-lysosomal ceramidase N-terminal domain-containing protein [Actinomycetota bacterium]
MQNATVTDKRRDPQRKWVAVNPELHLLRVDRSLAGGATEPLAAAVVFSIHGTGISQHAPEYNADVWAYLVGELRHQVDLRHGRRPVVGAMEGTHADVAPALRPGLAGYREARRIGQAIGQEAADLYDRLGPELVDRLPLDVGLREVDLDVDREVDGVVLPDRPAVGAALVAGAHENLTPVIHRIPPFRAGSPRRRRRPHPQAEKWVLGSSRLQPLVLPKGRFPRVLAVQALRIGPAVLLGLPFEITVESGRRIAAAVDVAVADRGVRRVVVSSVVNEYWGYVATAEEYRRQFYEGGHTLYGPNTQAFLAAHAARLAAATVGGGVFADVAAERRWDLRARRYLPEATTSGAPRRFTGRAAFTDPTATVDGYWEQTWVDAEPGALHWHEPLVRVESSDDDGVTWRPAAGHGHRTIDDQGWFVEVVHLGAVDGQHRYRTRWFEPTHRAGRRHRFVLLANNGRPEVAGDAFD